MYNRYQPFESYDHPRQDNRRDEREERAIRGRERAPQQRERQGRGLLGGLFRGLKKEWDSGDIILLLIILLLSSESDDMELLLILALVFLMN
ncbi:MAG: hypothetical protein LBR85_06970 [Oscillospiraceae bacterium]|nr:hypothetical protein [Oscillospiraceae bacterium]